MGPLSAALAAALAVAPARGSDDARRVDYRVGLDAPHRQYAHVRVRVRAPTGAHDDLAMPAWTPGSYLIRDFAKDVYDVRATDLRGRALDVERIDKQTWRIHHRGQSYEVHYRVYCAKRSVRTSHIDHHHASLLGTSVLTYVVGELDRPTRLRVDLPRGWSIHGALRRIPSAPDRAVYLADDYDHLVDAPLELGRPAVRTFEVDGTEFELVVTDADLAAVDVDRLAADAERVVAAQGAMMGGFPMSRYVLLLSMAAEGGGGLEHAGSTSMIMRPSAFDDEASGYAAAQRLVAHEFFHLWNVKRIHDVVLGPFDYARENHSTLLWFHEGFTETVEALSLVRAGFVDGDAFVRGLGSDYTRYRRRPGADHDPLSQLSFEAWVKAYQPADNHPNVSISYYAKGKLVGVLLDVELRVRAAAHGQQGSLLGVFRRLMASHGSKGRGITLADIRAAATAEAGEDMTWFFRDYVEGTKTLPLPETLAKIGVTATSHAAWEHPDGRPRSDADRHRAWAGLDLARDGEIDNIEPSSPADRAGLMRHDEIVAVDGFRADRRDAIERRIAAAGSGHSVSLSVFRDGRLLHRKVKLRDNPHRTWRFEPTPAAELDEATRRLREAWLATSTGTAAAAAASASRGGAGRGRGTR